MEVYFDDGSTFLFQAVGRINLVDWSKRVVELDNEDVGKALETVASGHGRIVDQNGKQVEGKKPGTKRGLKCGLKFVA